MGRNSDESPTSGVPPRAQPIYFGVPQPSDDGVDLVDLSITLWKGKWLVVGITLLFTLLSIIYSLSVTPVYRAESVLAPAGRSQPANSMGQLGGLASLAGVRLYSSSDNQHALAILQSKSFIAEFIEDKELLPTLFPDEWDDEQQEWVSDEPEMQRDIRDGVRVFTNNVMTVSEDAQTGLVTLGVEWTDPQVAAEWASELISRINERTRSSDIREFQRKLDYLNQQLSNANLVELRLAISRVIEEQVSAMMLAQSQTQYAFEVIDPAVPPKQRVRPRRTIMVIVGTLMGGVLAVLMLLSRFAVKRLSERARARPFT